MSERAGGVHPLHPAPRSTPALGAIICYPVVWLTFSAWIKIIYHSLILLIGHFNIDLKKTKSKKKLTGNNVK